MYTFDKTKLNVGIIGVISDSEIDKETKLLVTKGSTDTYCLNDRETWIPLQYGKGNYELLIVERDTTRLGSPTLRVESDRVFLDLEDYNAVFLQSNKYMNWNENMECIKFARQIELGEPDLYKGNDFLKAEYLYTYILENFDATSDSGVEFIYKTFDIDKVFTEKRGSFSSLVVMFNSMLRSMNVPTRLCVGTLFNKNPHIWSEIYLESRKKWTYVDLSLGMYLRHKFKDVNMSVVGTENYTLESFY